MTTSPPQPPADPADSGPDAAGNPDADGSVTSRYAWAAYAACAWGLLFAGISFYWGLGNRSLLDTIGGAIQRRALAGDTAVYAAVWATGFLKLVGAALALALVRPWGRRLPRRPLVFVAATAAVLLTLYGGLLEVGNALVATHVLKTSQPIEWKPLWWHLWVWDMSFLVWGILFALALAGFRSPTTPDSRPWRRRSRRTDDGRTATAV